MRTLLASLLLVSMHAACGTGSSSADLGSAPDLSTADLAPTLTSIAVQTTTPKILVDDHASFVATATYSDASQRDITASVVWSSASPSAATISAGGQALGVAPGTTLIVAKLDDVTSPGLSLAVRSVSSVALSWPGGGAGPTAKPGGVPVQITATAQLSDADTLDVTADPRTMWSAVDTTIVKSITNGVAMPGNNSGTTSISASFAGRTGMATMYVLP